MNRISRSVAATLALFSPVCVARVALAQTATVTLEQSEAVHPRVRGYEPRGLGRRHDRRPADPRVRERRRAARLHRLANPGERRRRPTQRNVATAKAAIAAGAIVFATPWNSAGDDELLAVLLLRDASERLRLVHEGPGRRPLRHQRPERARLRGPVRLAGLDRGALPRLRPELRRR